jgi:chitodextrinase
LNALQKVALARQVVTKMTGNASFTTPAPALTALTTGADNLEAAYNAALAGRITSKQLTSAMRDKEAVLASLITQEGAYVQNTSNGDKTKIESAGFETANPSSPIGALPAPENVELDANVNPGNMGVRWLKVDGAASYIVQRAQDADVLDYLSVATPTNTKVTVNTMSSGTRYWFRIAAVGAAGPGEWTLPVSKIAP